MRWRIPCLVLAGSLFFSNSCAPAKEVILVSAEGRRATQEQIDEDVWRLLPSGAVAWWRSDAKAMFHSQFGRQLSRVLTKSLPFSNAAGVVPRKDIDLVVAGLYATVGSDVVAICKGRFNRQKTVDAIAKNPTSASGYSIQSLGFAGEDMYVAGQVAMAILSDQTMVFGSQLGVRRVLERVEEGRLKRELPPWYEALIASAGAEFQLGIDLDSQPIPATLGEQFSFLRGLRAGRLLGNFREPGLNLAGTLTYDSPANSGIAGEQVLSVKKKLTQWSLLMAAMQIPQPLKRLESKPTGKDLQIVAEIRGEAVSAFLENAGKILAGTKAERWFPN